MKLIIHTSEGSHEFDMDLVQNIEVHDESGVLLGMSQGFNRPTIMVSNYRDDTQLAILPYKSGNGFEIVPLKPHKGS